MTRRRKILIGAGIAAGAAIFLLSGFTLWTRYGRGPRAPRIGLSISTDWYDRAGLNPAAYGLALSRAGANVRTLEPLDPGKLDAVLDGLDGLVLVGGEDDVDPALFGGDSGDARSVNRVRDEFEIELLRRAEERGLPVLAICRGAQLMAVAYGGKLGRLDPEKARRHGVTLRSLAAHPVTLEKGTFLAGLLGDGPHRVSSTHRQAILDPGRLRVVARSDDGVIEAVELSGPRFVVGIQWHPEWEPLAGERSLAPFRALVDAATKP